VPKSASVAGSGTVVSAQSGLPGVHATPGTNVPKLVPYENVALVIVSRLVTPGTDSVNVTGPKRNGLCESVSMEPLVGYGPDPMIVCAGAIPGFVAQITHSSSDPAGVLLLSAQPVSTKAPSVPVPSVIVISWPELPVRVPLV